MKRITPASVHVSSTVMKPGDQALADESTSAAILEAFGGRSRWMLDISGALGLHNDVVVWPKTFPASITSETSLVCTTPRCRYTRE
jgi:hypothetical protein